jgi:glycosyltransferase involved in cell wall biosynthesis
MMIDRPLRFCLITTFYPPYSFGGDAVFVQHLARELARRGHHVEVIHCKDAYRLLARHEPVQARDGHPNVTVHALESCLGPLSPLATKQLGLPLFKSARIRQILDEGFDVIHYHNVSLVGGPGILRYGEGIKLYTMHEYWLVCPTHVLFRFNRAACERPHCLACSLVHQRPPQLWRYLGLLDSAVKHIDAFIAPSRFSRDRHHHMGFDLPITYLPNFAPATDTPPPEPLETRDPIPDEPYFLFVGRLEKLKGLQTLIPVFRHHRRARLLIAGSGGYEPRLRRLAQGDNNIRFLGHLSPGQLQALYQHAIAVVLPSICFEMFPLVMIEAFKQETPVIARDLGAMPEVVEESAGGFVYGTGGELVAAMDQLLSRPALRDELGRRGYQAYHEHWTAQAHLKRYFALIGEAARKKGLGDWR